nr:hypothetical protein [Priestia megaterium]
MRESERFGLKIVTVTYEENKTNFYKKCGFTSGSGGVQYIDRERYLYGNGI